MKMLRFGEGVHKVNKGKGVSKVNKVNKGMECVWVEGHSLKKVPKKAKGWADIQIFQKFSLPSNTRDSGKMKKLLKSGWS